MGPEADVDVIGFGALNLDVIYSVPSLEGLTVPPGSEMFITEADMDGLMATMEGLGGPPVSVSAGGSAANTIHALRRMGFLTGYMGAVGEDEVAEYLVEGLGDPMFIGLVRRGRSGRTVIAVGPDGDRSIAVFPNTNDSLTVDDVDHLLLARTSILHLSAFVGYAPLEAQIEVVRRLPKDIIVTLDPGVLYSQRGLNGISPILERADVILPTEDELLILTAAGDMAKGAQLLLDMGIGTVVVKRGSRGIHTYWKDGEFGLPVEPVEVKGDAVGAGDVADAGFLAGMMLRRTPEECTRLAHACAVESLAGNGRDSYPDKEFLLKETGGRR